MIELKTRATLLLLLLLGVNSIAQNCGYVVEETTSAISCHNACNGTATITVSGGTPPYNFAWNNGNATNSISNLCPDTYIVTITGATGCESAFTMSEFVNPARLNANVIKFDIACGILGIISANPSGGNGSYMYMFTDYADSLDNAIFEDLTEGSYTLSVGDRLGCSTDTTLFVTEMECIEPLATKAFSPNGDGINETWNILNMDRFPNSTVYIYDRWGQKVFESQGYLEPWDGQGVFGIVPAASYYYVIIFDETDKNSQVVKGSVAVVR